MLRTIPPSTRQRCQYICRSCRSKGFGTWSEWNRSPHSLASVKADVGSNGSTSNVFSPQSAISKLQRDSHVYKRSSASITALSSRPFSHSRHFSTTFSLSSTSAEKSENTEKESAPDEQRLNYSRRFRGVKRLKLDALEEVQQDDELNQGSLTLSSEADGESRPVQPQEDSKAFTESGAVKHEADKPIDPPGVPLAEALSKSRKDSQEWSPSITSVEESVREDRDEPTSSFERLALDDVPVVALKVKQPPVPKLHHGLDRVLFNPGIYYVQDPRSRVFNFDPHVSKITPATEFDFDALGSFTPPSEDRNLKQIARKHKARYYSSTSSTTGVLTHLHYLISHWRKLDLSTFSKGFTQNHDSFTGIHKAPVSIFVKKDGSNYAITNDKSGIDDSGSSLLSLAGRSLEKLFTTSAKDFEKLKLVDHGKGSKKPKKSMNKTTKKDDALDESFHYTKFSDIVVRSQLDAHDARLPGTGVFDLKTRAVAPVRMDLHERIPDKTSYQITDSLGDSESFERERFDMMRSTMLKYSLQARLGRMDGIFVAYHNLDTIFGFQYISLPELDQMLHGTPMTQLGDYELRYSMKMFSSILNKARESLPDQHFRLVIETREKELPFTYIFAEPVSEEEYQSAHEAAKKQQQEDEKLLRSGRLQNDGPPESAEAKPSSQEPDQNEAELQQWLDFKDVVKEEISQDEIDTQSEDSAGSSATEISDEPSQSVDPDSHELLDHQCWLLGRTASMLRTDSTNLTHWQNTTPDRTIRARLAHVQHDIQISKKHLAELESKAKALKIQELAKTDSKLGRIISTLATATSSLNKSESDLTEMQANLKAENDGESSEGIDVEELKGELDDETQRNMERLHLAEIRFRTMVNVWAMRTESILKKPLTTLEMITYQNDQRALRQHIEESERFLEKMQATPSGLKKHKSFLSAALSTETRLQALWAKLVPAKQASTEQSPPQKSDGVKESKPNTPSSAPSIAVAEPKEPPLLAFVLTCRNVVNNEYVTRPYHLQHDDIWTMEYSIEEITDKKLARERYQACRQRRRKAFSRQTDEKRIDGWYRTQFMRQLINSSERGKMTKEKLEKLDAKKGIVVFGEKQPAKRTGTKRIALRS